MGKIKRIGVLTSGGDAPGMNAAIRGVTRTALYYGLSVTGIRYGYHGMIHNDFVELKANSVRTSTPCRLQARSIPLTASTPARCPEGPGTPSRLAQRLLPSIMIATWRGTTVISLS